MDYLDQLMADQGMNVVDSLKALTIVNTRELCRKNGFDIVMHTGQKKSIYQPEKHRWEESHEIAS